MRTWEVKFAGAMVPVVVKAKTINQAITAAKKERPLLKNIWQVTMIAGY